MTELDLINTPIHKLTESELAVLEAECRSDLRQNEQDIRLGVGAALSSSDVDELELKLDAIGEERQRRADLSSKTDMIERWADTRDHRHGLEEFLTWLVRVENATKLNDLHTDHILDQYFGVDQRQLDKERTALLESCDPG